MLVRTTDLVPEDLEENTKDLHLEALWLLKSSMPDPDLETLQLLAGLLQGDQCARSTLDGPATSPTEIQTSETLD